MTKFPKIAAFAVPAWALLALAQPAGAAEGATAAAAGAASAPSAATKASAPKEVCIKLVPDTGSRMARRMCKTKAEWAEEGIDFDGKK